MFKPCSHLWCPSQCPEPDRSLCGYASVTMNRRDLLLSSGLFLLGRTRTTVHGPAPSRAQQQAAPQARLLEALKANRLPITIADSGPAGRGWDLLVQQARDAHFTLIGEEHGVAETAQLS